MLANIKEWQPGRGTWDFVRDVLIIVTVTALVAVIVQTAGGGWS